MTDAILLLDVGNTRLRWAVDVDGSFLTGGQLVHGGQPAISDLDVMLNAEATPGRIVASCVADESVWERIAQWAQTRLALAPERVRSPARGLGVINAYADPARLGSDRWAALVALRALCPGYACVVDAGTATTVDLLAPGGRHLGGYILPGRRQLVSGVLEGTSVPAAELPVPERMPGRSTEACLANGALVALCALIESAVQRLESEARESVQCVLTGGDSALLSRHLEIPHVTEPALVLRGLARIAREDVASS